METTFYKRNNALSTQFYRGLIIISFVTLVISFIYKYFDYSILILIIFFTTEVFFNPKNIIIENFTLIVKSIHLGGLYNRFKMIKIDENFKIKSIGLVSSHDPNPDTGVVIFEGKNKNSLNQFDLYQIEYLNNQSKREIIKINLTALEYLKIEEIKRTT